MPHKKRKPPGRGGLSGSHVVADGLDTPRDNTSSPEKQTAHTEVAGRNCFPVLSNNAAMNAALQDGLRDHRLESQIQLVGEHWSSVRRLWLGTPDFLVNKKLLGGLPDDFWTGCGMPGLATVTEFGHRFEFADNGREAIILPCYDTIPGLVVASAKAHVDHIVDLVAVDVDQHDNFSRRRGNALVLGSAYLEIASQDDEPLPVYRNPINWFRTGGNGIVVLDWDYARDLLLDHKLIAENVDLGNRLDTALKADIWVMENAA